MSGERVGGQIFRAGGPKAGRVFSVSFKRACERYYRGSKQGSKGRRGICTRDEVQNKKKNVQTFPEQCKMTTGPEKKKNNCRVA